MIIRIKAGLGNQMFQYAFARSLELNYGVEDIFLDYSYYENSKKFKISTLNKYKVKQRIVAKEMLKKVCIFPHNFTLHSLKYRASVWFEKTINTLYYYETNREWRNPLTLLNYKYLDGYWISWRYSNEIMDYLSQEFQPIAPLNQKTETVIQQMSKEDAVFVGFRLGDYNTKKVKKHFYIPNMTYYKAAMLYIQKKKPNAVFYLFSNDIEWVKKNCKFECNVKYRENDDFVNDVEELEVMKSCKHAIIPNSTYHWWGARLINNPDKIVITPHLWFRDGSPIDIIPPEWIKINENGEIV